MGENLICDVCDEENLFVNLHYCCNCNFKFCKDCLKVYKDACVEYEFKESKYYYKFIFRRYHDKILCKKCVESKIEKFTNAFL
jgi:hypothetical protein